MPSFLSRQKELKHLPTLGGFVLKTLDFCFLVSSSNEAALFWCPSECYRFLQGVASRPSDFECSCFSRCAHPPLPQICLTPPLPARPWSVSGCSSCPLCIATTATATTGRFFFLFSVPSQGVNVTGIWTDVLLSGPGQWGSVSRMEGNVKDLWRPKHLNLRVVQTKHILFLSLMQANTRWLF